MILLIYLFRLRDNVFLIMIEIVVGKEFVPKVIPYVESARNNIDIIVYDWRFYPDDVASPASKLNQSLVRAVKRGVKVRAVVNKSDVLPRINALGIEARPAPVGRVLHSKLMYIDDRVLITGSHNYTKSAFQTNLEVSVILEREGGFPRIKQFVDNLIS